jgi:multidrug efflux system membrane fusion protein
VIPVQVALVKAESVPLTLDALGTVEAEHSVAIRAEVTGVLQKINFKEGDFVKAGQQLFEIDAATQLAEVDKAKANLARDQATLAEAKAQLHRLESLAAKEFITQQELSQAKAQEQVASATAGASLATLKSVQLQLAQARISSPIAGRAGIVNVKAGNLVNAASVTPLVVINDTQTVLVNFNVPQQQLQKIREQQRKGQLAVEIRREANADILASGVLAFIDNTVDAQTGTLRIKARISNKNETLWPGELVSLRLILEIQKEALTIPETAIQTGQNGSFVYVVTEGKAQIQAITIARQLAEKVVVSQGLAANQNVIINPPRILRPGSNVELASAKKERKGNPTEGARP